MSTLVLALRIAATLAAAAFVYGVWSAKPGVIWNAWLAQFATAEAVGVIVGGTFSGFVWYLRASNSVLFMIQGALIVAAVAWCVHHFWTERDLYPRAQRSWIEDKIIFAAVFLLSIGTSLYARWTRSRNRGGP